MVSIGLVSIPKLVTPRRLSLVLLVVYLVYMVAMYMKDLNEEKDQVQVAKVVALKTSNSSKDKSVVLLLNGEGVSKADVEEGNRGDDEGGGGEGEGEEEREGRGDPGGCDGFQDLGTQWASGADSDCLSENFPAFHFCFQVGQLWMLSENTIRKECSKLGLSTDGNKPQLIR